MRRRTASRVVFAKLGLQSGEHAPGPSNIGEVALSIVTVYICLMFVNAPDVKIAYWRSHFCECAMQGSRARIRIC